LIATDGYPNQKIMPKQAVLQSNMCMPIHSIYLNQTIKFLPVTLTIRLLILGSIADDDTSHTSVNHILFVVNS
jgi:hypothetical protein